LNGKKNLFVGLGCGKAYMDEIILKKFVKTKYNIDYFGVDTSKSMLNMAIKTLEKFNFTKKFILSDFFSRDLKSEILRLSAGYDNKVYTIFNNTFGNLNQTRIVNTLNNILVPGDKIWIDVRMKF
jgi:uncharacterized SAM-dependent methyltransferase